MDPEASGLIGICSLLLSKYESMQLKAHSQQRK